jgi:signal transduction histidine kinase
VFGVLALIFVEPSTVGPTTESFSLLLAQAASDAMFRARSYDAERAARQHAEMLAQARADVLSVVAHDLRNPLHLVMSSASLLMERGDLPPTQKKMLAISQRASQQMNRLIDDLLDATQLEAGRLTLAFGEVDAAALVRGTEETMQPTARERGVDLLVEAPEAPAPLVADEGRLLQALGNLVGNAIKFTGAGGRVALSATHDEGAMRFSVADSGPGIEPRHIEHLFDSFWQARDGDRRGVGLGLTITKRIVEAHAGRIWVKSTVGVGSTFSFAIPVSAPS